MLISLELLDNSEKKIFEKHKDILSSWINLELKKELKKAIEFHLPDNKWRLVN
jgi:hypothetical protein